MSTMRAAIIHDFGGDEKLSVEDVARPETGEGEVLIKVGASGLNPIDFKTRDGMGVNRRWENIQFPVILGWDVSGTVVKSRSPDFKEGDEVFGMPRFPEVAGGYAEYITSPANEITLKPANISHVEAAAVPLVALTAWQAIFETAGLEAGQRILVHAAAGGVGHVAVQLAKWKGAYVAGTCSAKNADFVTSLGADEIVDYTSKKFEDELSGMDVVFHTIAAEQRPQSYATLKPGGYLAGITGPISSEELDAHDVKATFVLVRPNGDQMNQIAGLLADGTLKVNIDATYNLDQIAEAHRHVEGGHTRGKVVIDLGG
jgi:NADPH:quinone reductase-like Zn-dependent oxidoreductase